MPLVSATDAKHLAPGLTGTGADTVLEELLDRADAMCAAWCGFGFDDGGTVLPTFAASTYTWLLAGRRHTKGRTLYLPVWPVVSITSIEDDPNEQFDGTSYLIASGDYVLRKRDGRVVIDPTSSEGWSDTDEETIKVVCSTGFASNAVPDDLRQAICLQAVSLLNSRASIGLTAASLGGASASPVDGAQGLTDEVRALLIPYRTSRGLP
jgi:hypothetical protein